MLGQQLCRPPLQLNQCCDHEPPHNRLELSDEEEDAHRLERIARGANQPIGWWLGAKDLKAAADVLANSPVNAGTDFAMQRVYRMLMGFALENLLKGVLVSIAPDRFVRENDKLFAWGKDGHDLVKLAQVARLELAADELDTCRRLSVFSTWGGRYWFPMSAREMGGGFSPVFDMRSTDGIVAERIYNRWSDLLQPREMTEPTPTDMGTDY